MNNIKAIRDRLGLTQAALAEGMGCTQGNVGHYEKGQTVPPDAARRLIAFAKTKELDLTFDDIYGNTDLPQEPATTAQAATETVAIEAMQDVAETVKVEIKHLVEEVRASLEHPSPLWDGVTERRHRDAPADTGNDGRGI